MESVNTNPRMKTKVCSYWLRGQCVYRDKCTFAHGLDEMRDTPFGPVVCVRWRIGRCNYGDTCPDYHCNEEDIPLQPPKKPFSMASALSKGESQSSMKHKIPPSSILSKSEYYQNLANCTPVTTSPATDNLAVNSDLGHTGHSVPNISSAQNQTYVNSTNSSTFACSTRPSLCVTNNNINNGNTCNNNKNNGSCANLVSSPQQQQQYLSCSPSSNLPPSTPSTSHPSPTYPHFHSVNFPNPSAKETLSANSLPFHPTADFTATLGNGNIESLNILKLNSSSSALQQQQQQNNGSSTLLGIHQHSSTAESLTAYNGHLHYLHPTSSAAPHPTLSGSSLSTSPNAAFGTPPLHNASRISSQQQHLNISQQQNKLSNTSFSSFPSSSRLSPSTHPNLGSSVSHHMIDSPPRLVSLSSLPNRSDPSHPANQSVVMQFSANDQCLVSNNCFDIQTTNKLQQILGNGVDASLSTHPSSFSFESAPHQVQSCTQQQVFEPSLSHLLSANMNHQTTNNTNNVAAHLKNSANNNNSNMIGGNHSSNSITTMGVKSVSNRKQQQLDIWGCWQPPNFSNNNSSNNNDPLMMKYNGSNNNNFVFPNHPIAMATTNASNSSSINNNTHNNCLSPPNSSSTSGQVMSHAPAVEMNGVCGLNNQQHSLVDPSYHQVQHQLQATHSSYMMMLNNQHLNKNSSYPSLTQQQHHNINGVPLLRDFNDSSTLVNRGGNAYSLMDSGSPLLPPNY